MIIWLLVSGGRPLTGLVTFEPSEQRCVTSERICSNLIRVNIVVERYRSCKVCGLRDHLKVQQNRF